jgi:DNA-binding PadR family transcriptional regulator
MSTKSGKRGEDGREAYLTPAMFHILLALADGQRHGYAIMQEVDRDTHGEMRLPPGTLYRSIKRLLGDGLIEEASAPAGEESDDERRRYYEITAAGREVAQGEARRLADIVGLARSKKLLDGREGA